jgi:hypothetical protein
VDPGDAAIQLKSAQVGIDRMFQELGVECSEMADQNGNEEQSFADSESEDATKKARMLVETNWKYIRRLSYQLLIHGTLEGPQLDQWLPGYQYDQS